MNLRLVLEGYTNQKGWGRSFIDWVQFVASEGSDLDTSAAPAELLASLLFIPASLPECPNTDTPLWSALMDGRGRAGETEVAMVERATSEHDDDDVVESESENVPLFWHW